MQNSRQAFTLLELLVVIAIIGILSSVILASLNSARDGATEAAGLAFENQAFKKLYNCLTGQWDFESGDGTDTANYLPDADLGVIVSTEGINGGTASAYDGTLSHGTNPRDQGYFGFEANTPKTMSGWIRVDSFTADTQPLRFGSTSTSNHMFSIETTAEDTWTIQHGIAGSYTIPVRNIDQWNHFLVTFDGTTSTAYLNGKQAGELAMNTDTVGVRPRIGGSSTNYFTGAIDNVRVFNCGF